MCGDSVILAATGGDVPRRVHALLHPPRLRWSRLGAAMLTAAALAACTSGASLGVSTEHRFERAHAGQAQSVAGAATAAPAAGSPPGPQLGQWSEDMVSAR